MTKFFENMMFSPCWYHYIFIVLLMPFSLFYGLVMYLRRVLSVKKDFGIPIISVGNLIVGGAGKTPFVIELASKYDDVTIISRGYGRQSKGLVEVSQKGNILTSVKESGDEAMLMAISLPLASVIVCEDREKAILHAKQNGTKLIILDDGFNRVKIQKFEILLEPLIVKNYLPFPAGAFREFWFMKRYADMCLKEGKDFLREVNYENLSSKMLLVTAIANPYRLDMYLPENIVGKIYLEDHAYFNERELKKLLSECKAKSILVTEKDEVKMTGFKLPLSKMRLKLDINKDIFIQIDQYLNQYKKDSTL